MSEIVTGIQQETASRLGLTTEEVKEMCPSEIEREIWKTKREEFVQERLFGALRLRIIDWKYARTYSVRSNPSLVFGPQPWDE